MAAWLNWLVLLWCFFGETTYSFFVPQIPQFQVRGRAVHMEASFYHLISVMWIFLLSVPKCTTCHLKERPLSCFSCCISAAKICLPWNAYWSLVIQENGWLLRTHWNNHQKNTIQKVPISAILTEARDQRFLLKETDTFQCQLSLQSLPTCLPLSKNCDHHRKQRSRIWQTSIWKEKLWCTLFFYLLSKQLHHCTNTITFWWASSTSCNLEFQW